jgi:nucleoside-diphosphate-sugar epimerase
MKLLVTGASGFVGRALCQHLASIGHEVRPAVRKPSAVPGERVLPADDAPAWQQALSGCESVLHLAGRAHVMHEHASDPLQAFREANVEATLVLAQRAAQAGVRRFVFVSSIKVNGESTAPGAYFRAEDVPQPCDPYAVSKWEAEQGLQRIAQASGMALVIVRPPLVYGPGVKGNFAQMLRWVSKAVPLPLGAVHNQRSMIALDNLIDFLALCALPAQSPQASNRVFLVSDGAPVSTPDLLHKIAGAYGRSIWLPPVPPVLLRLFASALGKSEAIDRLLGSLVIDDQPARQLLGWQPPVSMDEQLQRMAHAARA